MRLARPLVIMARGASQAAVRRRPSSASSCVKPCIRKKPAASPALRALQSCMAIPMYLAGFTNVADLTVLSIEAGGGIDEYTTTVRLAKNMKASKVYRLYIDEGDVVRNAEYVREATPAELRRWEAARRGN